MKGAKDGKGEGNKQQQAGPALFPRLHVAETKQVGPRAPPRNKMALYEQFTIPFHRFRSSPIPLPSSTQNSVNPSMSPALMPVFPPQVHFFSLHHHPHTYLKFCIFPTLSFRTGMWAGAYWHDGILRYVFGRHCRLWVTCVLCTHNMHLLCQMHLVAVSGCQ